MNILTNIHRASTIEIERKSYGSDTWTSIAIRAKDGSYYELAIHDADPESPVKITGGGLADWSAKAASVLDRARTWLIDNIDCQCEPGFHCRACALLSDIVRLQAAKPTETIETPK